MLTACQPEQVEIIRTVVVTEVVNEIIPGDVETVVVTEVVEVPVEIESEDEAVTLYWNWGDEPITGDPALATDGISVDLTGNLFVGLTRFDPVTGEVIPYLATGGKPARMNKAARPGPLHYAMMWPG